LSSHYPPYPPYVHHPASFAQAGQGGHAWYPQYNAGQPGAGWSGNTPPGGYPGYQPSQGSYPARNSPPFFNFSNDRFIKGLLIGAAATYLVTNEDVQRSLIKGVVKTWSMLQGGVEEIKERFHDAEAELHHDAERAGTRNDG